MPATQECLSPFVCIYKQIKVTQDNLPFGHALDPEGVKNSDETHVLVHLQPIKQRPGTKHACEQESPHGPFPYEEDGVSWSWQGTQQENKTKIIAYSTVVSKTSIHRQFANPSSPHTQHHTTLLQNLSVNKTSRQPSTVVQQTCVPIRDIPSHYYWPTGTLPSHRHRSLLRPPLFQQIPPPPRRLTRRGRGGSVPACWKGAR